MHYIKNVAAPELRKEYSGFLEVHHELHVTRELQQLRHKNAGVLLTPPVLGRVALHCSASHSNKYIKYLGVHMPVLKTKSNAKQTIFTKYSAMIFPVDVIKIEIIANELTLSFSSVIFVSAILNSSLVSNIFLC